MKKIYIKLILTAIAALMLYSCTKVYTRDDFDKLADKTFYLLPLESTINIPADIPSWKKIQENISTSVINGVKEMDVLKVKDSIEKRYGIIVDTSLFEKARTHPEESLKYFRALKNANATGSRSFVASFSSGYEGYLDSLLYTEVSEIKQTKPCIIISHDTNIDGKNIQTDIQIIIYTNDEAKGITTHKRSMKWTSIGKEDAFDPAYIDYKAIYEGLSKITEFKYNDYSGSGIYSNDSLYLDGSK